MLHHLDAKAEEKDREMHSWTLNNFRYSLYDFSLGVLFNAFVVLCYFNIILRSYRLSSILLLRLVRCALFLSHSVVSVAFCPLSMLCFLSLFLHVLHVTRPIVHNSMSDCCQFILPTTTNKTRHFCVPVCVYVCTFNNINCLVDWLSVVAWNR